jgi:hypothetical protein
VIAALADALRLDDGQRRELYTLAMVSQASGLCPSARPLARVVAPTVTALLKGLGTTPAFVGGPANDALAGNDAWEQLVRPLGMLDGALPNLARFVFLHPDARTVYPDWIATADEQVSRLRAATGRWGDDHEFAMLMDELRTSPDFNERWSMSAATEKRRGTTRIVHPDLGQLRLNYEVLLLPADFDEQRLITWLPADDSTATALAGAGAAPGPDGLVLTGAKGGPLRQHVWQAQWANARRAVALEGLHFHDLRARRRDVGGLDRRWHQGAHASPGPCLASGRPALPARHRRAIRPSPTPCRT